jgi:hypothetical protein
MLNLLYSLLAAGLTVALFVLPHWLSLAAALVPGALVGLITAMVLARRTFKQLEAVMMRGAACLQSMPPKPEQAIAIMQQAYPLAKRQFGIKSQIDAQIGIIYFLQREFGRAQPYLSRSLLFGHWMAGAMLGVIQYKKKDVAGMRRTFATVLRKAKNQGLAHSLYAYLLVQVGDRDGAQKVLSAAAAHTGADPRVKEGLLALQNGRKLKMRAYHEQWYQFHLERPPMAQPMMQAGGKAQRMARRGRG